MNVGRPCYKSPLLKHPLLLAQSMAEYGGAGGGIVGAIESLVGSVVGSVTTSVNEHTIFWILGACVVGMWLFRRR